MNVGKVNYVGYQNIITSRTCSVWTPSRPEQFTQSQRYSHYILRYRALKSVQNQTQRSLLRVYIHLNFPSALHHQNVFLPCQGSSLPQVTQWCRRNSDAFLARNFVHEVLPMEIKITDSKMGRHSNDVNQSLCPSLSLETTNRVLPDQRGGKKQAYRFFFISSIRREQIKQHWVDDGGDRLLPRFNNWYYPKQEDRN